MEEGQQLGLLQERVSLSLPLPLCCRSWSVADRRLSLVRLCYSGELARVAWGLLWQWFWLDRRLGPFPGLEHRWVAELVGQLGVIGWYSALGG